MIADCSGVAGGQGEHLTTKATVVYRQLMAEMARIEKSAASHVSNQGLIVTRCRLGGAASLQRLC